MKAFKKFVASAAAAAATMTSSSSASATTMEHSATSHTASIEIDATTQTQTNSHTASASQWTKPTPQLHHHTAATKSKRIHERRQRIQRKLSELPPGAKLHRMTVEELEAASRNASGDDPKLEKVENTWLRRGDLGMDGERIGGLRERDLSRAGGGSSTNEERNGDFGRKLWGTSDYDPYTTSGLASNVEYYDKWQQAYRMLGGYIDCDFKQGGGGSHDNNNGGGGEDGGVCSRWMMWAAYIDPNYAGGEYDEYFGNNAPGILDCHSPDTDWVLIGVYRQEFYQYIEQISKHLWAIDEYEYIVALSGLAYMTDDECFGVGYDENGDQLYASVQPLQGGSFQMGLYSDAQCVYVNTKTSYTYDDFAAKSDLNLGSKDQTDDDAFRSQASTYWYNSQEYSLTNLNTVYDDFKYCTSCVDYPTYQDGYFIGDDGTDDDDLINQCWKFYSHDSFNCDVDCVAMGSAQGSITWISYNGKQFGTLISGQYEEHDMHGLEGTSTASAVYSTSHEHRMERLKANLFLTVAGIVFVATFLAFAVARGSSKKKTISSRSRSRRLLDSDYAGSGTRSSGDRHRSSRSSSRARVEGSGAERSKTRSKSRSGAAEASSSSRSKSRSRRERDGNYVPPSDSRTDRDREREREKRRSKSQSQSRKKSSSSSRRQVDDF